MTPDQTLARIREITLENTSLTTRQQGLLQMYTSASLLNNHAETDQLRAALHVCIDSICDNISLINLLTRQLIDSGWTGS